MGGMAPNTPHGDTVAHTTYSRFGKYCNGVAFKLTMGEVSGDVTQLSGAVDALWYQKFDLPNAGGFESTANTKNHNSGYYLDLKANGAKLFDAYAFGANGVARFDYNVVRFNYGERELVVEKESESKDGTMEKVVSIEPEQTLTLGLATIGTLMKAANSRASGIDQRFTGGGGPQLIVTATGSVVDSLFDFSAFAIYENERLPEITDEDTGAVTGGDIFQRVLASFRALAAFDFGILKIGADGIFAKDALSDYHRLTGGGFVEFPTAIGLNAGIKGTVDWVNNPPPGHEAFNHTAQLYLGYSYGF